MAKVPEFEMDDPLFHFYNKKGVESFRKLVQKEAVFAQKFVEEQIEEGVSPELVATLAGLGAGAAALGIAIPTALGTIAAATAAEGATAGVAAGLAGLTGAEITATLAAAGGGTIAAGGAGMAGGVAAAAADAGAAAALGTTAVAAAAVVLPVALIGGTIYGVMSQAKLKQTMKELIRLSFEYESILENDTRSEVIELLALIRLLRAREIINVRYPEKEGD